MIISPYVKGESIDPITKQWVATVKENIDYKDDDFFLFATGTRGTGKTSLSLHIYELYDPVDGDIKYIGLNRKDHALALNEARIKPTLRFCMYDEANVSKKDHATTYNKKLIELYFQIRGLKIFHIWNNPSIDIITKDFIKECIKGLIFIFTKDKNRPRLFYYFTKDKLIKMYEDKGNLSHHTLKKYAKKYALYRGWFKDYDGRLKQDYLGKKGDKMNTVVDEFTELYGESKLTNREMAKALGIHESTFYHWRDEMIEEGILKEGDDYMKNSADRYYFAAHITDKIKKWRNTKKVLEKQAKQATESIITREEATNPPLEKPKEKAKAKKKIKGQT